MQTNGRSDVETGQAKAGSVHYIDRLPARALEEHEKLPFFGPPDPKRWPVHKRLFLGGILFPPLWFVGAFLPVRDIQDNWAELFRFRCQAMSMIICVIGAALLVIETAFRNT